MLASIQFSECARLRYYDAVHSRGLAGGWLAITASKHTFGPDLIAGAPT